MSSYEEQALGVLDRARCGPHCGFQKYSDGVAIEGHCPLCHEEFDWAMEERPGHLSQHRGMSRHHSGQISYFAEYNERRNSL